MKKVLVTLEIEMPDEFGTPDSMADMSTPDLLEKVRTEVEQACWLNSDISPESVRVNLIINGEVAHVEERSQTASGASELAAPSGVLDHGSQVIVTYRDEETQATVIGYDSRYKLHKVRTACGRVILRKVNRQIDPVSA